MPHVTDNWLEMSVAAQTAMRVESLLEDLLTSITHHQGLLLGSANHCLGLRPKLCLVQPLV
eukprot:5572754-Ditylum_brightwellii.AAC.2